MAEVKPQRIQRKRTKGWRMQDASPNGLPIVYVGRGTKWGNPFTVQDLMAAESCTRAVAAQCVTQSFTDCLYDPELACESDVGAVMRRIKADIGELRGKTLVCWCPLIDKDGKPFPCHADPLLVLANQPESEGR